MESTVAELLGSTAKIGPRELTFRILGPGLGTTIFTNCAATPPPVGSGEVLGGCASPAEPPFLLTTGWHELRTNGLVAVQQLPPSALANADPVNCGMLLRPGDTFRFYVDKDCLDGGLAVFACTADGVLPLCDTSASVIVTVNRIDSVMDLRTNTLAGKDRVPPASDITCNTPPP